MAGNNPIIAVFCRQVRYSLMFTVLVALTLFVPEVHSAGDWSPLTRDGIHDPDSPATRVLQSPEEALSVLPFDSAGNQVRWVKALEEGYINPRTNIMPGTKIEVLDKDVLMKDTAGMPFVLFPHKPHTEWLDCSNCHDKIFKKKAGETPVNMFEVLQGEYCGQCHGAVAFPLTECKRCHSVQQ
jgi:c(7)-type cytochrome triheme protein